MLLQDPTVSILFGSEQINAARINRYRIHCGGLLLLPKPLYGIDSEHNFYILLALVDSLGLTVVPDKSQGHLVFKARLKRFEFSLDDEPGYFAASIQLIPVQGKVRCIEQHRVYCSFEREEIHTSVRDDFFVYEMSDILRLEIFYQPISKAKDFQPPFGYNEEQESYEDLVAA